MDYVELYREHGAAAICVMREQELTDLPSHVSLDRDVNDLRLAFLAVRYFPKDKLASSYAARLAWEMGIDDSAVHMADCDRRM